MLILRRDGDNTTLDVGSAYVEVNAFDSGAASCSDNDLFQLVIDSGAGTANLNVALMFV